MTYETAIFLLDIALDQLEEYSENTNVVGKKGSFHIPTARNMLKHLPELEKPNEQR